MKRYFAWKKVLKASEHVPHKEITEEEYCVYKMSGEFTRLYAIDTDRLLISTTEDGITYSSEYSAKTRDRFLDDANDIADKVIYSLCQEFKKELIEKLGFK